MQHIVLRLLYLAAALIGWIGQPAEAANKSEAETIFDSANEESLRACASPRARELFARAEELGRTNSRLYLAWTYDPLHCKEHGTDASKAAELYRSLADSKSPGADNAVEAWAALVERRLATSEPYHNVADLLAHYGAALLQTDSSNALKFLTRAFVGGSDAAYETLSRIVGFIDQSDTARSPLRSDYLHRSAACALGSALTSRFPGGEREEEAIKVLRKCDGSYDLARLLLKRVHELRATEADRIWLLELSPHLRSSFSEELEVVMPQLLNSTRLEKSSQDERLAAANYLYRTADVRMLTTNSWRSARTNFDLALRIDPSPDSVQRHADALFNLVLNGPSRSGEANVGVDQLEALRTAASQYESHLGVLTTDQLARLAMLTWRGFAPPKSTTHHLDHLRALVNRGDQTAKNTLEFLSSIENASPVERPSISAIEEVRQGRNRPGDGLCREDNLQLAIDVQNSLYVRMTRMRGVPDVSREVAHNTSLQQMLPTGTAILLYGRDYLRHCVWLVDSTGLVAFASVYATDGLVGDQLRAFHRLEGITAAQSTRVPMLKNGSAEYLHSELPESATDRQPSTLDPARSLSLLLLPSTVKSRVTAYSHVIVVPYGQIGAVPFAALPLSSDGASLIDFSSISIAPSIVDLYASLVQDEEEGFRRLIPACPRGTSSTAQSRTMVGPRALVVGDPAFSRDDPDFIMPQLPGARDEAMAVANALGVRPLIGSDATPAAVRRAAQDAEFLYFATHGFSYSRNGTKGFLALAGGRWNAEQIQGTCLKQARLAILSACQTGLGQATDGGIIGLARAFQIAGVPDVVMSLWKINDFSSNELMTRLVSQLQLGKRPHDALRVAMLETRKIYVERKHWASFTVFSETPQ